MSDTKNQTGGANFASAPADLLCRCCGCREDAVRNINLYVIGSEGFDVCHDCEMKIVEFCRALTGTATKCRMAGYRAAKIVAAAKASQNKNAEAHSAA